MAAPQRAHGLRRHLVPVLTVAAHLGWFRAEGKISSYRVIGEIYGSKKDRTLFITLGKL